MHYGESSAARRPILGGGKAVEAGHAKPAGHAAIQVAERRVSGVFDHRDTSGYCQESRHVRELSEQVHGYNSGKLAAHGLQRLRINRQKPRVHIDEDRLVASSHNGTDQRRIRKQGEGDARSRLQIERRKQKPKCLPAAAGPELRAVAKESKPLGKRTAAENRPQPGREIRWRVGQGKPGNGV